MALDRRTREIADCFKRKLQELLGGRLLDVRVFGSRARGDSRPDSDLDIFVLVDERDSASTEAICQVADEVSDAYGGAMPISPRVMARDHFDRLIGLERQIARDILTEGVPL